jgi:FkbM family methyltransferase
MHNESANEVRHGTGVGLSIPSRTGFSRLLWRLRAIGKKPAALKLARFYFSLLFRDGREVTLRRGPLRGCRWICRSGQQFWMPLGVYEMETAAWLSSTLAEGLTFVDIGANAGYLTLLGSLRVGNKGRVFAFEPVPANAKAVRSLMDLNRRRNVVVECMAVGARSQPAVGFVVEGQNANSHLAEVILSHAATKPVAQVTTAMVSLDDYCAEDAIRPDVIKIDVEGAEALVLRGMSKTLQSVRPKLIVSTHSAALAVECRSLLREAGFALHQLPGFAHEIIAE